MNRFAIAASCLAVLGLFCASSMAQAEDAARYTMTIKKVEVKPTKPDGASWDINDGKPDLAVIVRNVTDKNAKEFETDALEDRVVGDFNKPTTFEFLDGQTVEFEVVDKDVAVNDSIGKVQKKMTGSILGSKTIELKDFGQVILLTVSVKKL